MLPSSSSTVSSVPRPPQTHNGVSKVNTEANQKAPTGGTAQKSSSTSNGNTSISSLLALPSSRPGTGADRVIALLRLYARVLLKQIDALVLDALLLGPFGFGVSGGGASVMQLSTYLGVIPRLVLDVVRGGSSLSNSGIVISSRSLPDINARGEDDGSSDEDDEAGGKNARDGGASSDEDNDFGLNGGRRTRALTQIRYMVNFSRAVPYAYAHLTKAFMALIKRPASLESALDAPSSSSSGGSNGAGATIEGGNTNTSRGSNSSNSGITGGRCVTAGGRFWHCFKCNVWLPQTSPHRREVKAICHCGVCGGNLLFMAAQEARRCFELLRGKGLVPTSGGSSTNTQQQQEQQQRIMETRQKFALPQHWLIVLYRDPSLLQQLSSFEYLSSSKLVCTALTDIVLAPTDWATVEEVAALQQHAAAGGLVSAGTANLFRLQYSHSGQRPIRVTLALSEHKDREAAEKNSLKVSKRSTLPPWMAPPEAKEGEGERKGGYGEGRSSGPNKEGSLLGGKKRQRDEAIHRTERVDTYIDNTSTASVMVGATDLWRGDDPHIMSWTSFGDSFDGGSSLNEASIPPKKSDSEVVSDIARATLSDKYFVIDL